VGSDREAFYKRGYHGKSIKLDIKKKKAMHNLDKHRTNGEGEMQITKEKKGFGTGK